MTNAEPSTEDDIEQREIELEADDIASSITRILVEAFRAKENRDPTPDEIDMLISELTEERIAEMLGETFIPAEATLDGDSADDDEEEVDDVDENDDAEVEAKVEIKDPISDKAVEGKSTENADINRTEDSGDESASKRRKLGVSSAEPVVGTVEL